MPLLHEAKKFCKDYFKFDNSVLAVYIFGSVLTEKFKETSDIDLAALIEDKVYKKDPLKAIAPVHLFTAKLSRSFNRETDVTILNSSSIEIAYEVVATGICIYEKDIDKRMDFENKIKGMYFDFIPFIHELREQKNARGRR